MPPKPVDNVIDYDRLVREIVDRLPEPKQGPQGEPGEPGQRGAQGPQGEQGPPGRDAVFNEKELIQKVKAAVLAEFKGRGSFEIELKGN